MADKENPPAFPVIASQQVYTHGMTMRDYFAAHALAGMMANSTVAIANKADAIVCANAAYYAADAMLKARAKGADRG